MKQHGLTFLLLVTLLVSSNCASDNLLYFYGEPFFTSTTGFVKIDPSNLSWESTARGFATEFQDFASSIKGVQYDSTSNNAVIYGYFHFYDDVFVGGLLHINPNTLQVSSWGKGVLGKAVSTGTWLSDTEFVLAGLFTGFAQAPSTDLSLVGICDNNGQNCFDLGQQIPGVKNPYDIIAIGRILFLYIIGEDGPEVAKYDYTDGNPNKEWEISLTSQCVGSSISRCFFVKYQNEPWFFGVVNSNQIGAYQYTNNTWIFHPTSNVYNSSVVGLASVSPDGQSLYFKGGISANSSEFYQWSDLEKNWVSWFNYTCESATLSSWDAFDEGLIFTCNETIFRATHGTDGVVLDRFTAGPTCKSYNSLTVDSSSEFMIVMCPVNQTKELESEIITISTYDINTLDVKYCCKNMSRLEVLVLNPQGYCIYGDKIFLSGNFEQVDNVPVKQKMAIWDQREDSWFPVSTELNSTVNTCYCDSDGTKMVALCQMNQNDKPMLIIDYSENIATESLEVFVVNNTGNFTYTGSVLLDGDTIYFTASVQGRSNLTLFSWTQEEGSKAISTVRGSGAVDFEFVEDVFFLAGSFVVNNTSSRLTEYFMDNNTWTQPGLLMLSSTKSGTSYAVDYCSNGLMYVGGDFTSAGSLRTQNVVGYNLNGTAVDAMGGGLPNGVPKVVCVDDKLFLVYFQAGCPQQLYAYCGVLLYYNLNAQTYSYPIALGTGAIAKGANMETPSSHKSSGGGLSETAKALIITAVVLGVVGAVIGGFFLIRKWVKDYTRSFYEEINDVVQSKSRDEEINFETERFELKNVLGRGSFGTVWSCVLPERGAATFAVKQILLSKGDTLRIRAVQNEIEILKKLRHRHIVNFLGSKMETSASSIEFFLFMELFEKPCSLKGVIMKKVDKAQKYNYLEWFTFAEVRKFLRQISDGLYYLHQQGIAHRDLKSANILVRTEGKSTAVKSLHIADFGISKSMDSGSKMASTVVGTSGFMAPEILRQEKYDAFKADIWAFGIVIFEILTWEEPLAAGVRPEFDVTHPLAHYNKQFSKVLELFHDCTEENPDQRPSCEELFNECSSL